jgi:hypothetical protein
MAHSVYRNARLIALLSEKILDKKNLCVQNLSPNGDYLTRLKVNWRINRITSTWLATHHVASQLKWHEEENVKFSLLTPEGTWRVGIDIFLFRICFIESAWTGSWQWPLSVVFPKPTNCLFRIDSSLPSHPPTFGLLPAQHEKRGKAKRQSLTCFSSDAITLLRLRSDDANQ